MKYAIEIKTWNGWRLDTDEDGRALLLDRLHARRALADMKGWQKRYGYGSQQLRIRVVNTPAKRNRKARQEAKRRWVTTYSTDRAFGGQEEGGWWYDTGEPQRGTCQSFYSEANARKEQDRRNELAEADNKSRGSRGNISSVICDYALAVHCEPHPPESYPSQTPRYE